MKVTGEGIVADMYRDLVDILKPLVRYYDVNFQLCLPHPHRPDYKKYVKIGGLIFISWFMLFLEPFGLRLRSVIMSNYYPEKSSERTVWLYHQILRKRSSLMNFAKSKARKQITKTGAFRNETMTCMELFRAKIDR